MSTLTIDFLGLPDQAYKFCMIELTYAAFDLLEPRILMAQSEQDMADRRTRLATYFANQTSASLLRQKAGRQRHPVLKFEETAPEWHEFSPAWLSRHFQNIYKEACRLCGGEVPGMPERRKERFGDRKRYVRKNRPSKGAQMPAQG